MAAQLPLNPFAVQRVFAGPTGRGRWWEQRRLQAFVIPVGWKWPTHAGGLGPLQVLMNGADRDRTTPGDLALVEFSLISKSQDFFDLSHGHSPGRQADLPLSKGSLT